MRRWTGWLAIAGLFLVSGLLLVAFGRPAPSMSLTDRTRAVAQQLRCPVCQGESVADSPSPISRALRAIIRQRLREGQTPQQITSYMVSRYGNWILLAPPIDGIGAVAWLAPPLLLLAGFAALAVIAVIWRPAKSGADIDTNDEYVKRVRAEVEST